MPQHAPVPSVFTAHVKYVPAAIDDAPVKLKTSTGDAEDDDDELPS